MLRAVVANFLKSLNEREFDAPLLALLSSQDFYDIHYIHGGFEFGKDVVAKRDNPSTGETSQYLIQSKAGDIGYTEWRAVRPQLEECEYNTLGHPSFNENLPRVVILVTTGRLKGAAPTDAQQFRRNCVSRGLADFEVWDEQTILDWLCLEPSLGLIDHAGQDELIALISAINDGLATEPMLERYSRRWLDGDDDLRLRQAAIETSIVCNSFRKKQRLDLAAMTALHLLRAACMTSSADTVDGLPHATSSRGLFIGYATELLDELEPLLSDPIALANEFAGPVAIVTYPAACSRLIEILSLLALIGYGEIAQRAENAVYVLCNKHPGAARPISDQFAVALIPATIVLARIDQTSALNFLRSVSEWLLDRHDPEKSGLGLASLDEPEERAVERLFGGALTITDVEPRRGSYIATVVLDLLITLDSQELYEAVRENFTALRMLPVIATADERTASWRRGGDYVWPNPRVEYGPWATTYPRHHYRETPTSVKTAILLTSVCRNRHYVDAITSLLSEK
ncbi:hypothetical protein BayCH28_25975 [Mycolicibacterium sp. CH28]|uniref:hypothetical protein n=1 Tax=Mycolicibacterium sp. CH28 TaxID=2512237 RepID=UPI0010821A98|nr:hypothetical protein [Mycolicibacterium sp. CH28]TGD84355.1 hypothetical protein BayCH28_25975 [Mycolicibacterium sp. CH28]